MIEMNARLAQTDRRQNIHDEIRAQSLQCKFLRITYNFALAKYYMPETPGEYYDEILEPTRLELNACIDRLEELQNTELYGPDLPVERVRPEPNPNPEFPPPPPLEPAPPPEEAPGGGPATIVPWPVEIPEPTTEPIPPPPVSEPAPEPNIPLTSAPQPSAAAVCDPMYGTFYDPRTGQCRGSVSGLPTSPFSSFSSPGTIPLTQAAPIPGGASSFMGQVSIAKPRVRRSFGGSGFRRPF